MSAEAAKDSETGGQLQVLVRALSGPDAAHDAEVLVRELGAVPGLSLRLAERQGLEGLGSELDGADVLHLVGPADDVLRLPDTTPGWRGLLGAFVPDAGPLRVVLDGCAPMALDAGELDAGELAAAPGEGQVFGGELVDVCERMGRANATAFLLAWYARIAAGSSDREAFDLAFAESDGSQFPEPLQPGRSGSQEQLDEHYRAARGTTNEPRVTVWYGTNRRPNPAGSKDPEPYGTTPDDELHTGRCVVSVPRAMRIGHLKQLRARSLGRNRLQLVEHEVLTGDPYWQALSKALSEAAEPGEGCVLLYLHGYRNLFTEAALRAAQLHADLKVPGVTAFFSWPSLGRTEGYMVDEDTVQQSERHLCRFLQDLCTRSGAQKVHVLAHSMGNRSLLRVAMRAAERSAATAGIALGQVILAAPDVGSRFFSAEAGVYTSLADGTTLYVSSKDKALRSSGILHGAPRAGFAPPLTLVDGIHTIETGSVDLTMLGHGYFAEARPVLTDIHDLLHNARHPSVRMGLTQGGAGPNHWIFRP